MNVLVINCGSSSIKAAIIVHDSGERLLRIHVERIGEPEPRVRFDDGEWRACRGGSHEEALRDVLPALADRLGGKPIEAVGHRVVHGGDRFNQPVRIDDAVEAAIRAVSPLAPLHNPPNLAGIAAARKVWPELAQVAVFDTAFHATLPNRARSYAIDRELAERHGVRRYGFHGTSHAYISARAAEFLGADLRDLRLITCHLGNGASVCAVEYGRSVETSMGMTPLEGLVMGTRSGDIDPGALIALMRAEELDADALDQLLNKKSGLAGLSGVGPDLRDIEERASAGDDRCRLALQVFAHRLRKYIGAYAAVLGGLDAIVFSGGIGENSASMRHRVAQRLELFGAHLDEDKNRAVRVTRAAPVAQISTPRSRTHLLVVATDEEHEIARGTAAIAAGRDAVSGVRPIPVAISARHIHLTEASIAALFGPGHELTPRNELSQPGQYACEETLDVVGPKRTIPSVRVLGPARPKDQVEVSRTDEFFLGLDAPVRDSGDVGGSAACTLVGPKGQVTLKEGVICARRHIHMHPDDAAHFGVKDRDVVEVTIDSEGRDLTFGDVLVRVSPHFRLEMHLDTDEANAAELKPGAEGMLAETSGRARLTRKLTRGQGVD
jgi:acetate kinase